MNAYFYFMAYYYNQIENYQKSIELGEKTLDIYKKHYGTNSAYTAGVLVSLGRIYLLEGNLEKSKTYLEEALTSYKETPLFRKIYLYETFAEFYLKKSKTATGEQKELLKKEAANSLSQALKGMEFYPKDSPRTKEIQLKLRAILRTLKKSR